MGTLFTGLTYCLPRDIYHFGVKYPSRSRGYPLRSCARRTLCRGTLQKDDVMAAKLA